MKKLILLLVLLLVMTVVARAIPDPSAAYCTLQGYDFEIRTDEQGNQYGVCVFPDGSECSAWHYYCKCESEGIGCWPGDFSCHWPCKEMPCKDAGEDVFVSTCCEGLGEIYPLHIFDDNCNILEIIGWLFLCSDCGNGICEAWESRCNCPADCALPRIIYVDDDATGANDGSSWVDAFNDLQDALAAAWSSDEIRVAQGIYKPGPPDPPPPPPTSLDNGTQAEEPFIERMATFQLKNGVSIKGGYAGFGEPDPNARDIVTYETILSGDLSGNDVYVNDPRDLLDEPTRQENSYHVVTGSGTNKTAVLDGFTITGGNANGVPYHCAGGGMYNDFGSPTLANCLFVSNSADTGGGIFNRFSKNLILINCTFRRNQARMWAGGMYNLNSILCLNNCIFIENLSGFCGGGVDNLYSSLKLFNCKFSGNAADCFGGGIHWDDPFNVIIINCVFVGNSSKYGGAISGEMGMGYPTIIKNCTFSCNSAEEKGGGLHIFPPPAPCVRPQSVKYDWGCYIYNCILWGDIPDEIYDTPAVITYSDVQGGLTGEGNIDIDPCFISSGYWDVNSVWVDGNYHLLPYSACIDAGDPNYVPEPNETDLDGRPRVMGGRIDMGAYEYMPSISAEARIIPRTINLASKGNRLTCYIWLPDDYSVADIDSNSIFLNVAIRAEYVQVNEEKQVMVASFSRGELRSIISTGEVELTITGQLTDGTIFEGTDVIRIVDRSGRKI